jgi:hypothetical protein
LILSYNGVNKKEYAVWLIQWIIIIIIVDSNILGY